MAQEKKFFGFGRNVFFTGLVSFFMDVSSEMIYPLVPLFLANVPGVNKAMIGLIEGIAESTTSLLKVFSGWLSDRIGQRKSLMLAGPAIALILLQLYHNGYPLNNPFYFADCIHQKGTTENGNIQLSTVFNGDRYC